jgi:hypothetical protein
MTLEWIMVMMSSIIWTKVLTVVGVDANPQLCAVCAERFADSINNGQLTILNVALAASQQNGSGALFGWVWERAHAARDFFR